MRGRGEKQRKMAEEIDRAVYLAILENGPIFFNQLFKLLKSRGEVRSTRTLAKSLRRLMKKNLITREPAVLHLHHPNVLNPPIKEQIFIFGRYENGKFVPDENAPQKLSLITSEKPGSPAAWRRKLKRLIFGKKKVYVVKVKAEIRP